MTGQRQAHIRILGLRDLIEIRNPGGPLGQVSVENCGPTELTDYRNPSIAEAQKTVGFVQRFGFGSLWLKTHGQPEKPAAESLAKLTSLNRDAASG